MAVRVGAALLVLTAGVALAFYVIRPGGASLACYLADRDPPEVRIQAPAGPVRARVAVALGISDNCGVGEVRVLLDGQPLNGAPPQLEIDTAKLPDGDHRLTVEAADVSLRRNTGRAEAIFKTDNTPPALTVPANPVAIKQGEARPVEITSNEALSRLEFRWGDVTVPVTAGLSSLAFPVAAGPTDPPGVRRLEVTAWDQAGNEARLVVEVRIQPGTFPVDYVPVPPELTPLLDPEVLVQEERYLAGVFGQVTWPPRWTGGVRRPVTGPISSAFGSRRSYAGGVLSAPHLGVDLAVPAGTPVIAAADGRVALAEGLRVRGNAVVIDHGLGVYTAYYHLSQIRVQPGQEVRAGDLLGLAGSTGLATGPHLHWELRVFGVPADPLGWVGAGH
jgi:murein DD-endopeptidase MepM/ murein hydrolase activator NlpD